MDIRPMTASHVPSLAALEAVCFPDPWSAQALAEELDNPAAVFLVAAQGERVLGYVGMHHILDEGYITNVAVDPTARRQGIARRLLEALVAYGEKNALTRLTLEVRTSNAPAIALYEGSGWVKDGVRPGFYAHPVESAIIYSKYL